MKKLLSLLMSIFMVSTLVGCSSTKTIDTINIESLPIYYRAVKDDQYGCDEDGNKAYISVSDDESTKYSIDPIAQTCADIGDGMINIFVHLIPNEGYEFKDGFTINYDYVYSDYINDDGVNIPIKEEDLENAQELFPDAKLGDVVLVYKAYKYEVEYTCVHEDAYFIDEAGQSEYLGYSAEITESDTYDTAYCTQYDSDGTINDKYTTEDYYDENGNDIKYVLKCEMHPEDNVVIETEYNSNGDETKKVTTYADGSKIIETWDYTDETHSTYKRYENEISEANLVETFEYVDTLDDNGNIVYAVGIKDGNTDKKYEYTHEYDANGYEVKYTASVDGVVYRTKTYTYDENYNEIEYLNVYDYNGSYSSSRYVRTYELVN